MSQYSQPIASALRLIAKKGELCTWRQYTMEPGSTDWNEDEASPFVDYSVSIVFLPYDSRTATFTFQQIDGDVTRITEYALMGAVPFTPAIRDSIIRSDGTVIKPAGLDRLKPATEVILYTIGIVG